MIINPVKRKTILQGKGITQRRLARAIGYSQDQIKHVINLKRFTPHIQEAIARYFGKSVEELFGKWAWMRIARQRGRRLRINGKVQRFKGSRD